PVGGSLVFSIGVPAAPGGRMAGMATGLAAGLWLSTLALYLGLLAGTGGAFFLAWPGRESVTPAGRGVVRAASGLGATAAVVLVGLQGLDALGEELAALLTPRPWQAGIASPFGLTAVAALIALLCAWLAQRRLARFPALVGLLGAGLALTLSGHAGTAAPQWLTRPSVFIHGMAAAYWVGGLVPLALVVRERRGAALSALERFSSLAVPAVGLMALSGLVLGVVQIETPGALLATDYGRVFLVKMAAVAGLMALAGLNRWRLTPALRTRPSDAAALVRTILCEVALMVLILAAVAGWRLTPPPRALAASLSAPASLHIHDAAAMADMTIAPGRAGPVALSLSLLTGDFGPLDAREVTIGFSHPGAGIEPIERRAVREPDGSWRVEDLMLPVPGRWQVRVDALITDFDKATLEGSVEIAP
ncbi:MAG: copper resistance D family protein, partial [Microvirga sp.]